MSWLWLATSHEEWLGLTGIGSSESELESAEEDVAVGANARGDDMLSLLDELFVVRISNA